MDARFPSAPPVRSADGVVAAIDRAASRTGTDFGYLLGQARIESGLNPDARARTSSATGLFQFLDQTWLATVKRHGADHGLGAAADAIHRTPGGRYAVADPSARSAILGLRTDPDAAASMAAAFATDNRAHLERRLGRTAEPVDLYLAHFLGAGGAAAFLSHHDASPDAAAAPLFPRAAAANRNVFYARDGRARSLTEVRDRFAAKLSDAGAGATPSVRPTTSGEGPRFVAPADWLRLTRSAPSAMAPAPMTADRADTTAPLTIVTTAEGATRAIDPARVRAAWHLRALLGGNVA